MTGPRTSVSALLALAASSQLRPTWAAAGAVCDTTSLSECNCSRPGLGHLVPGQYRGIVANYMSYMTSTSSPQFRVRAQEFQHCTGGEIRFADASDPFTDPIADLGTRAMEGQNLFDGYFMSYSHFPEASALGLAETLNDRVRQSMEQLEWEDFYPTVKIMGQYRRNGRNDLDFLMFDGDFFVPLVRLDLLEKFQKPIPNTWQEAVDLAHFFHGKDLNDDGEPDFGLCHFPMAGSDLWGDWWPELIYATWATMAQTDGHSQGFFFDPETFVPNLNSTSFREAAKIWKKLSNVSGEGCATDNMVTGRCALGFSPPGCWKGVFLNGMARKDENGTVLWRPTLANGQYAEPYRLQPFGSSNVEDPKSGKLVPCSRKRCPRSEAVNARGHVNADDRASILPPSPLQGKLINRAPFFWSGGLGTLIRKSAPKVVKDLLWDFFVYINSPVTSVPDVAAYSSWIDSWRREQLTPEGENFVVLGTWSRESYAEHRSVMEKSLGQDSNAALNLRIPGIKEYTSEHLGADITLFFTDQITLDELVSKVKDGWDATSRAHELLEQLAIYRAALGRDALEIPELCRLHPSEMDAKDPSLCRDDKSGTYQLVLRALSGIIGSFLVFSFASWVFTTARAKRRLLAEQHQRKQDFVRQSLDNVGTLKFPMVLVRAPSFLTLGAILDNETLRDRKDVELQFLDTCRDIDAFLEQMNIIFLSHQWLGFASPDPGAVQYKCACKAVLKLVHERAWSLSQTYIWCDFCCIPQRCSGVQTLAIASLPVYASKVSAFIVVAPTALHQGWQTSVAGTLTSSGSELACSLETYKRRAWCRAEVLSHALSKGVSSMYVATEAGLTPLVDYEALIDEAIYVFEGDLTCCRMKHDNMTICDKERLMVPFLGLYSYVIHTLKWNKDKMDASTVEFFQKIVAERERVFPATFCFNDCAKRSKTTRPLFKGLLSMMEEEVKNTVETQFEEFRVSKFLSQTTSPSLASRRSSMQRLTSAVASCDEEVCKVCNDGHQGDEPPPLPEEWSNLAVSPPEGQRADLCITWPPMPEP